MSLVVMSKAGPPTLAEMRDEFGFGYVIFDWKEGEEALRYLSKLSLDRSFSFRVIDMRDDAYHIVFSDCPFSVRDARLFIRLSQKEGGF